MLNFENVYNFYNFRASFTARLIMCEYSESPTKVPILNLVFLDGTGEMKAVIWRDFVKIWIPELVVNKVYHVTHFKVVPTAHRFPRLRPGLYEVEFGKWTKVP